MAYASRAGRARTNAASPRAHGICQRCGFRYNRADLHWQYDYRGAVLQNLRILVCNRCMDHHQQQLRAIVLPADPVPIKQPRPEQYAEASGDFRVTSAAPTIDPVTGIPIQNGDKIVTEDGSYRTLQPIGIPDGLSLNAIMPQYQKQHYGPTIAVLSTIGDGNYTVSVTCSAPHGLAADGQIIASGMLDHHADGAYSVTVVTPMAFRYTTTKSVPSGSLLTGGSRIWSAHIGIPRGYDAIPKTGA